MIKQLCKNITICTLALSTTFTVFPATSFAKINSEIKQVSEKNIDSDTKMYTRTATTSDSQKNITQSLQFNFLTESNYDKETVFIKAKGTIGSGLRILDPNGYWNSTLRWPGAYSVSIQNVDNNNNTNVTDFAPKNQDESREVKYTYGYKTGGDFSINRGGLTGNITKESNYSESISYQQPSYRTLLDQPTTNKGVSWKVEAHLINNMGHDHTRQLTNDSDNRTKNEIFSFTRTGNLWAKDNFTPKNKMPVTVSEGFNPEFLAVMSHDKKDQGKSRFIVHYKRSMDYYKLDWNRRGVWGYWSGENHVDQKEEKLSALYEVDWKTHDVKFIKVINDKEKK
ncbi:leukocidin/hemolysin toxin family protein [Staphylococcus sp. SS251]|nr:leukocidin/hemolysin toxin family protein [Staphylococcus singaporensis]MBE5664670.1 leukocidin/hemolysin toxin family protein [Staphylococcus singaporensis]MBE5667046.1 leukocidin/hemolysin toxin family protein [Staphylococcus singaporensis]MBE5673323.1 leukocidin/hemolysin toxin family protein [Staphylococcus singaporensis]MBE5679190.1 leukocidin/hemolysin toxin family protein [Staphylococcus singaporensis]